MSEYARLVVAVDSRQVKQAEKDLGKLPSAADRVEKAVGRAGAAIGAMVTIQALRSLQQLSEQHVRLESRVTRLSASAEDAARTYGRLSEIARNTGTGLGTTVRLWESLSGTLRELGANDSQVLRLTETLQKIGAVGGSSAEEMSGALRQLGQGLAGGVLRAEEFNSVLEGMPELARELARGLGIPFGELRQQMLDGRLTTEVVLEALRGRASAIDAEFAKLPRTVSEASAALRNDLGNALAELDKAAGASSGLAALIDGLAKGIRFTAGDYTDQERMNILYAKRAEELEELESLQGRLVRAAGLEEAARNRIKKIETEIMEIQDRRVEQIKAENAALESSKAAKQTEEEKKAADELAKSFASQLEALRRQKVLHGEVTEAARISYEIQSGALQGLGNKEADRIMGLAQELDARKELTEQQKVQIALLRETGQLRAANDAQWQLEYAEKIAEYERQGNQAAADRLRTLKAIREIQMESVQEPGTVEGVTKAPVSGGLDAAVGGANSEIARLNEQTILLDQWRTTELEKHRQFMEAKAITSGEYAKRETNIHEQHAAGAQKIERAKNQAIMASSAEFFGNMAALSQSENKKIATIGKMSAIAQATIQGYVAVSNALAVQPYPLGVALAASAAVAAAANVANISGVGFATGGYTGPGGKYEPAGVVHRGEVVWSQEDIRRAGGVGVVEAMRLGKPGFYDGGVVDMAPVRARQQQPAIPAGDASSAAPLSITHVWQITPGMNDAIQAEITRMLPMITDATARGVQQQISRGGSMARSVGRR
jgi:tape measure domain-containing protein